MKSTLLTIVLLVFVTVKADTVKHTGGSSKIEPQSIEKAANTSYVVNHEFCYSCLSEEENEEKESLEEVPTYAQLERDPRADLPSSFTICSSVMTTYGSLQIEV